MTAEKLARRFHELYESLAPNFGYETRRESAVPWDEVPEQNRNLMIAVADKLIDELGLKRTMTKTPKFKIGDIVKHYGSIGTIAKIDGIHYWLDFIDGTRSNVIYESELTLTTQLEDDRGKHVWGEDYGRTES